MKVAIGSDHAGYALKQDVCRFLSDRQISFQDFGVFSTDRADYPDTGIAVAEAVASGEFERGILICSTGIGMSIVANKVAGIRAALCADRECAQLSREHNDSNVLVLGARNLASDAAAEVVETWLSTDFPGEDRHAKRVNKITDIDMKYTRGGR